MRWLRVHRAQGKTELPKREWGGVRRVGEGAIESTQREDSRVAKERGG